MICSTTIADVTQGGALMWSCMIAAFQLSSFRIHTSQGADTFQETGPFRCVCVMEMFVVNWFDERKTLGEKVWKGLFMDLFIDVEQNKVYGEMTGRGEGAEVQSASSMVVWCRRGAWACTVPQAELHVVALI